MRCDGINFNSSSTERKYFIKYNIQYIEYKIHILIEIRLHKTLVKPFKIVLILT